MICVQGIQHDSHSWVNEFSETGLLPEQPHHEIPTNNRKHGCTNFSDLVNKKGVIPIRSKILGSYLISEVQQAHSQPSKDDGEM